MAEAAVHLPTDGGLGRRLAADRLTPAHFGGDAVSVYQLALGSSFLSSSEATGA